MKILETVCGAPGRSSSMALLERTTRKGNSEKVSHSMIMGAPKSNANLSVRDKLRLAVRQIEMTETPPPGLNLNEAFLKEMFTLHIKSVDATRDLQKKLEETNLMLALERLKCQEKEKRIQELNNNVTELETELQQEQDSHERTKVSYQQFLKVQQQNRNIASVKDQQEVSSNHQRLKTQTLSKNHQNSKSTPSSANNENTKASENVNKKTRGASSTTKPRTYRRHRNSRGPPLLSPAITPDTPFRNAKPGNVLEWASDKKQSGSGDNCDEDQELPSDVEAEGDSCKTTNVPKKIGVIESNSSTTLYNSYLNNKAPTTAAAVFSAMGKNYSYDPKVIGDISNAIHKTILNETLENENAKERARRSRRTNSGKRSRSSSSEGKMKTRRRRKSRGKSEKSSGKTQTSNKERLFDSGNTKQLLQTLEKICQNRTVNSKNEVNHENVSINGINPLSAPSMKQNSTTASNPQTNCLLDKDNQSKSRGRRKKYDPEDKCNQAISPPKASNSTPVRTITTRNSVARNLANISSTTTTTAPVNNRARTPISGASANANTAATSTRKPNSEVLSSTNVATKVILSPDIVSKPAVSVPEISKSLSSTSVVQEKLSFPATAPSLVKSDVFSSENILASSTGQGLTSSPPLIASAVAAVSKINLPVSSTSAAIPKANSPGTSASAGLPKIIDLTTLASNDAAVPKVNLVSDITVMKINNLTKSTSLSPKIITLSSNTEENENGACKENNPGTGASLLKTALSSNSTLSKILPAEPTQPTVGSITKSVISGLPKLGLGSTELGKVKPQLPTATSTTNTTSHIERINHGYTRNMNPLIKNIPTVSTADSTITTANNTTCKTPVINVQPKKPICYGSAREDQTKQKCETISKCDDDCVVIPYPVTRFSSEVKLNQRENCMTTIFPYFVLDAPPLVSRKKEKRFATPKTAEGNVEVPSWRVMEFDSLLLNDDENEKLEDIQDMDTEDTVFLKRHLRPETEEKRRKRWDSQRMREETYLERLKRRMAMREKIPHPHPPPKKSKSGKGTSVTDTAEESEEDMESFQPCIEDIRYIRVDADIPIGTFGYPMPIVQKGCFDLPWSPTAVPPPSPTPATSTSTTSKSLPPNGYSPRRNGTVVINGYGSPVSNNMITPPTTPTNPLPNSISSCSAAGQGHGQVQSVSNSKDIHVPTNCPSASTRQSSKRL